MPDSDDDTVPFTPTGEPMKRPETPPAPTSKWLRGVGGTSADIWAIDKKEWALKNKLGDIIADVFEISHVQFAGSVDISLKKVLDDVERNVRLRISGLHTDEEDKNATDKIVDTLFVLAQSENVPVQKLVTLLEDEANRLQRNSRDEGMTR